MPFLVPGLKVPWILRDCFLHRIKPAQELEKVKPLSLWDHNLKAPPHKNKEIAQKPELSEIHVQNQAE